MMRMRAIGGRLAGAVTMLVWVVVLVVAAIPATALADGKVFTRLSAIPVIPDQEAVIHYDAASGVQTLIIDTRFIAPPRASDAAPPDAEGEGGDVPPPEYAWVVPAPAAGGTPEVLAVSPGTVSAVRSALLPRVIDDPHGPALPATVAVIALLTLLAVNQRAWVVNLAVIGFAVVMIGALLMPALGKARSSPRTAAVAGVEVLDRKFVGAYDVAIIAATDAAPGSGHAVVAWLTSSGFHIPAGVEPVLADYAARNWCFVAARLHAADDPSSPLLNPHPLAVRFATPEPVYPLKLTGVGNGPLKVDLYVFGPEMARSDGFEVVRCGPVSITPAQSPDHPVVRSQSSAITLHHDGVAAIIPATAAVATKLSATLTAEQMSSDAVIRWSRPRWTGAAVYTPRAVANRAALAAAATLLAGMVLIAIAVRLRRLERRSTFTWALAPLLASGLAAAITYAALPETTSVSLTYESPIHQRIWHQEAWFRLFHGLFEHEREHGADAVTIDVARAIMAGFIAETRADHRRSPELREISGRIREEDSPGNYLIRESPERPGALEYIWFNADGMPTSTVIW